MPRDFETSGSEDADMLHMRCIMQHTIGGALTLEPNRAEVR